MNALCEQAGCSEEDKRKHAWKWAKKRWHSHPSQEFIAWWEPFEFDEESGASRGGHHEARRCWARKTVGGWKRRWYGIIAEDAWNIALYFDEFDAWRLAGRPERVLEFVSVAVSPERLKEFWSELKEAISRIGKKVSEPLPHDYDATNKPA